MARDAPCFSVLVSGAPEVQNHRNHRPEVEYGKVPQAVRVPVPVSVEREEIPALHFDDLRSIAGPAVSTKIERRRYDDPEPVRAYADYPSP